MYVDDCEEGLYRIMRSNYPHPLNLGTSELVTIDHLADLVAEIAGKRIAKRYDLSKPQGVRGRNSDNTKLRQVLGWEPQISLREGLMSTSTAGSSRSLRRQGGPCTKITSYYKKRWLGQSRTTTSSVRPRLLVESRQGGFLSLSRDNLQLEVGFTS
jgi:hypothetical protein